MFIAITIKPKNCGQNDTKKWQQCLPLLFLFGEIKNEQMDENDDLDDDLAIKKTKIYEKNDLHSFRNFQVYMGELRNKCVKNMQDASNVSYEEWKM